MDFSSMNFLAIIVAAIASFALGALWYSPVLFGKAWQKELGFTEENLQGSNIALIFGSSFVMMLIMALGMAYLLPHLTNGAPNAMSGLHYGLIIGVLFISTSMAINLLYQRKSFKLWAIDAFYQIIFLGLSGLIIGAWQ